MEREEGTLRERLLGRLDDIGLTQAQFARMLDVAPQSLTNWMSRGSVPKKHLNNVCEILKVDRKWLVFGGATHQAPLTIDADLLASIIDDVQAAVELVGQEWPTNKVTRLAVDLYAVCVGTGESLNIRQAVQLAVLQRGETQ